MSPQMISNVSTSRLGPRGGSAGNELPAEVEAEEEEVMVGEEGVVLEKGVRMVATMLVARVANIRQA